MYTYKVGISAQEHDDFVKASSQTNLLQSAKWAKVKDNWENFRVGFYKDNKQVASASILIKSLPLGFTMFYIPRGPVMNYNDKELVNFVLNSLKKIGKSRRALFVKFDPALLLKSYFIGEDVTDNNDSLTAIENLIASGAHWTGRTTAIADSIQPRYQANRYTQEDVVSTFPKHTKRLIKQGEKRGIRCFRASIDDVQKFSDVVSLTEARKSINLRNSDYFKKLMEIYGDDAYLHLVTIDIHAKLNELNKQLSKIEQELSETAEHQKKRLTKLTDQKNSTENFIKEFLEFEQKYKDEVTIAGILSIGYGDTMEMLYAGMNDDFKKFYPQYSLYPVVFNDAYKNGIKWANMGGVEGDLQDGLTTFKSHFNPKIEEYIGEFNLATSIFYHLSNFAYTLRKKFRHKH